jgi:RNA polymerase sigma-70 factor (ECF subfamily)
MARRAEIHLVEGEATLLAFVALLEVLTPLERAVYLLHAVFDHTLDEVASIVGIPESSCRALLRRAKARVTLRRS